MEVDEKILTDQIVVHGGYRKPKVSELAIVQFWLIPYHMFQAFAWQWRWFQKYSLQKQEYDQDAKEYLTRNVVGISANTWEGLDDKTKGRLMAQELWISEKEEAFRQQQITRARQQREYEDFEPE